MSGLEFQSKILQLKSDGMNLSRYRKPKLMSGSLESQDDDFATFFFIKGDMVNGRAWGVTKPSIPLNIKTARGMPYTITSVDFIPTSAYGDIKDHPSLEHLVPLGLAAPGTVNFTDLPRLLEFQKQFKVGTIIDSFYTKIDDSWRVIVKKEPKFRGRELPPFVSPGVWKLDDNEPDPAMTKWRVIHLAGLDSRPAYGSMAIKKAECSGSLLKCDSQLRAASLPIMCGKKFRGIINEIDRQRSFMAVLSSPSIAETQIVTPASRMVNCKKRDEHGNCIKTDSKKPNAK